MNSDLEVVQRWQDAGGVWEVVTRTSDSVTIALCQCTGGEEVERLVSRDPELMAFVMADGRDPGP